MADSVADLANAGKTDFSFISKGVDNGIQYAQGQAQLDLQKQIADQRAEELKQQQQANLLAKSQHLFDTVTKGLGQVGKARDMYFENAKQQATLFGLGGRFDPTFWAYMNDPKNNDAALKAVNDYNNAMAEGDFVTAQKSLAGANGLIDADSIKNYSATLQAAKKEKEANDIAKGHLGVEQQNAETNRLKIGAEQTKESAKNAISLRKDADKVQQIYQKVEDPFNTVVTELSKKTAAGDAAANVAMLKIAGVTRTNQKEIEAFGSGLGNFQTQAEQAGLKKLGTGQQYNDQNRQDLLNLAQSLKDNIPGEKKNALSSIYNSAKSLAPAQLQNGEIINPNNLKLFGVNAAGAPSEQNAPIAKPKPPVPPASLSRFTPQTQALIQKAILEGAPIDKIGKRVNSKIPDNEVKYFKDLAAFQQQQGGQ